MQKPSIEGCKKVRDIVMSSKIGIFHLLLITCLFVGVLKYPYYGAGVNAIIDLIWVEFTTAYKITQFSVSKLFNLCFLLFTFAYKNKVVNYMIACFSTIDLVCGIGYLIIRALPNVQPPCDRFFYSTPSVDIVVSILVNAGFILSVSLLRLSIIRHKKRHSAPNA